MGKYFFIALLFLAGNVYAMCDTRVIDIQSATAVSFYYDKIDLQHLIGTYAPRFVKRDFIHHRDCGKADRIYAVSADKTIYRTVALESNQQNLFRFPTDFEVEPELLHVALHQIVHHVLPLVAAF